MPNRMFGFNNVDSAGATPYPGRTVAVTPSLNNSTVVTFSVSSNLPNTTMKYNLVGVQTTDFVDGLITANFTTDSNGNANITKALVTVTGDISNLSFYANIVSQNDLNLAQSSNVNIINILPITATGGTISFSNGYKVHTFITNTNFNVSAINANTNATVYVQMVGGGGAGGLGAISGKPDPDSSIKLRLPGAGGAGGNVIVANLNVNDFIVTNYPVVIGAGGNGSVTASLASKSGGNTSFKGYIASGGAHGGSYNASAISGFITGGGGGTLVTGSNTAGAFHITSNTTPVGQVLYGTWYNPTVNVLYYKSEEPAVYTTWDDPDGDPRLTANVFNQQGLRIANQGGDGTAFDGGNAIVGSYGHSASFRNNWSVSAAGGGAASTSTGFDATGFWGRGDANEISQQLLLNSGNGGIGTIVWGNDPTTTFTSNTTLQFRSTYGANDRIAMLGAGGAGARAWSANASTSIELVRGGTTLSRGSGGTPDFNGIVGTGQGGGGATSRFISQAEIENANDNTFVRSSAPGGSGVVKVAYISSFREFSV